MRLSFSRRLLVALAGLTVGVASLTVMATPAQAAGCNWATPCGEVQNNDSNDAVAVITNWCDGSRTDIVGDPPCRSTTGHMLYAFPGDHLGGGNVDIDGFRASTGCRTASSVTSTPWDRLAQGSSHWKKIDDWTDATITQVDCADGMSCRNGDNPYYAGAGLTSKVAKSVVQNGTTLQLRYNTRTRCAWAHVVNPRSRDTFWVDRSTNGGRNWRQLDIVWNNDSTWWSPLFTLARNDAGVVMRACGNIGGGATRCTAWY
jgi:hypothetical protein